MKIEVLAAAADAVHCRIVDLPEGSTAGEAAAASGLLPGFALAGMAIFGKRVDAGRPLQAGDRLELLRALAIDPKQARRKRAEAARALKAAR